MEKKQEKPLRVKARLLDGRFSSADGRIYLAGILYHAWFCIHAPHVIEGLGNYDDEKYQVKLPVGQTKSGIYLASKGVYEEEATNVEYYNKRPDFFSEPRAGYLNQKTGLVSDSVGQYRAHRNTNIIHVAKNNVIDFYCVGIASEVKQYLAYVPGIGSKVAAGLGIVKAWEVEEITEDYSLLHPEYGLMRPTPVEETEGLNLEGYAVLYYADRPPYWDSRNQKLCYVPRSGGER